VSKPSSEGAGIKQFKCYIMSALSNNQGPNNDYPTMTALWGIMAVGILIIILIVNLIIL